MKLKNTITLALAATFLLNFSSCNHTKASKKDNAQDVVSENGEDKVVLQPTTPDKAIDFVFMFKVKPENQKRYDEVREQQFAITAKEPGTLMYNIYKNNEGVYCQHERYANEAAALTHIKNTQKQLEEWYKLTEMQRVLTFGNISEEYKKQFQLQEVFAFDDNVAKDANAEVNQETVVDYFFAFEVSPENLKRYEEVRKEQFRITKTEPTTLIYDVYKDANGMYWQHERYASLAAAKLHTTNTAKYLQEWFKLVDLKQIIELTNPEQMDSEYPMDSYQPYARVDK